MMVLMSEMWDTHIWMMREVWALGLIILFAYPLHELSSAVWNFLRRKARPYVPRQSTIDVHIMIITVLVVITVFYLTILLL